MPRKKRVPEAPATSSNGATVTLAVPGAPLEVALDELKTILEARLSEYQMAVARITDILATISPKPRIGRPPGRPPKTPAATTA